MALAKVTTVKTELLGVTKKRRAVTLAIIECQLCPGLVMGREQEAASIQAKAPLPYLRISNKAPGEETYQIGEILDSARMHLFHAHGIYQNPETPPQKEEIHDANLKVSIDHMSISESSPRVFQTKIEYMVECTCGWVSDGFSDFAELVNTANAQHYNFITSKDVEKFKNLVSCEPLILADVLDSEKKLVPVLKRVPKIEAA